MGPRTQEPITKKNIKTIIKVVWLKKSSGSDVFASEF